MSVHRNRRGYHLVASKLDSLRRRGVADVLRGRMKMYGAKIRVNNRTVGRIIEFLGNMIYMDGMRFSVDSDIITTGHKSTLAFGLHEIEERQLVRKWIPGNIPVLEFGGGLGVVSCLINKKLADPARHIVVEPNRAMAGLLERNRNLNRCSFQIENRALAYDSEYVSFHAEGSFVGGRVTNQIGNEGHSLVSATTAEKLMDKYGLCQAGIVCDVEGGEADLIRREIASLGRRIRYLLVEVHPKILGHSEVDDLFSMLEAHGLFLRERCGDTAFFSRADVGG